MIENVDHFLVYDRPHDVEILDHAGRGTVALQRAAQRDLEAVRVSVGPGAFPQVIRENVRRLEPEVLTNLHPAGFEVERIVSLRINRAELVITAVTGEAAPPRLNTGLYDVGADGRPFILPSVGGINPNVRVGDLAFGFAADHIEPAVSIRDPDDRRNVSLNVLACIGNEAVVLTGDAKGAKGVVTGKHGGIEHVIVDFSPDVMRKMAIGDKVQVWSCGVGLRLLEATDVSAFNADPDFLEAWAPEMGADGTLAVRVAKIVPAAVMGSGLGRATVVRGDYDIQTFDDEIAAEYGLREIRLGDIVAIVDADHSYGRIYRSGAVSVGVVVHGRSFVAGHGPGVTTLLTSPSGRIDPVIDETANLATILKIR